MASDALAVDAFEYLLEVEARAQPVGRLDGSGLAGTTEFIHFKVAECHLLIPINSSSEILLNVPFTRVPGSDPWLYGVSNNRGKLLTLIDLNAYFQDNESSGIFGRRIIVVDNQGDAYGLVVDQVLGVVHSSTLQLASAKSSLGREKLDAVLLQEFSNGIENLHLFDLPQFFSQMLSSAN